MKVVKPLYKQLFGKVTTITYIGKVAYKDDWEHISK